MSHEQLSPVLHSYLMLGLQSCWDTPDGDQSSTPAVQAPVYTGSHSSILQTRSGIPGSRAVCILQRPKLQSLGLESWQAVCTLLWRASRKVDRLKKKKLKSQWN